MIHDVLLLFEAVGSEIASLPMEGADINAVSILHDLKGFIVIIKGELCTPCPLRQMTVVALVNVLFMHVGHKDR